MLRLRNNEVISYYTGSMHDQPFEEMDHTADWALKVRGKNLPDLFVNAAIGMIGLMGIVPNDAEPSNKPITLSAYDKESLLVAWLEELLFGIEIHKVTYTALVVDQIEGEALHANVQEVPYTSIEKPIKAVTFTELEIRKSDFGYETTIVFDV